jgi:hypothetical protein
MHESERGIISWKWAPNGEYTTFSAYKIQFQGSFNPIQQGKLWKAKAEPKVKFFAWTAMHEKILTADNLASRGMHHNPICPQCRAHPEIAQHLLSACNFIKEVLRMMTWSSATGPPR